eukprot:g409.t1
MTVSCFTKAEDTNFTKCGIDKLNVSEVSLSPYPVTPGSTLSVKISGGPTTVAVNGGNATLALKVFGATLYYRVFDICTQFGVTCPVQKGAKWTGEIKQDIPKDAPTGITVQAEVNIYDSLKKNLSCIDMNVTPE